MTQAATTHLDFIGGSKALERGATGGEPDWLQELRREGLRRFESAGLPTSRDEEWRDTNLSPLLDASFRPVDGPAGEPADDTLPVGARIDLGGPRLTFVDGRFAPALSRTTDLPSGVWVGSLREAAESHPDLVRRHLAGDEANETGPFGDLNLACLSDGAAVLVPARTTLDRPVQLLYLSGAGGETVSHPRTLVVAGESASAPVVEIFAGVEPTAYFTNSVTRLVAEANGSVDHVRVQLESEKAFHIAGLVTRQARDSRIRSCVVDLGGRIVRNNIRSVLAGEGADCLLSGLYLTHGSQHVDNHTTLDHAAAHCDSRELFKGILDGKSRSVFTGRIIVRPGAQKTDAKQSNPNLLLSASALAHTRPQLEIYADDVKCTHGATVGQMDGEAVFYLRSRGIDHATARNMLVHAFAGEVLDMLTNETLREALETLIHERLDAAGGS
jgi:Fe-S cluster assembly protein SufD